jgi:hypothetical protein
MPLICLEGPPNQLFLPPYQLLLLQILFCLDLKFYTFRFVSFQKRMMPGRAFIFRQNLFEVFWLIQVLLLVFNLLFQLLKTKYPSQ